MSDDLYSIRMHASGGGEHLSGGEQLVAFDGLQLEVAALLQRALNHERGNAEKINICIDPIDGAELVRGPLPRMEDSRYEQIGAARHAAAELLMTAGIERRAAAGALAALAEGAAPGGLVMRGAMLIDAVTGRRLEQDPVRGVRASRLGVDLAKRRELFDLLQAAGFESSRVAEALTLAAKVTSHPDILAELCWSDDPSYLTGYVATGNLYTRLTPLKASGDRFGGRAFFVRHGSDLAGLVQYLEQTPFLVDDLVPLRESLRVLAL